ncbi:NAD-dependent epimerase/dehydratase family protein [Klenkia sp. PcliD-1-E]|uniref:NAD-dependent epimerase/dehydratase family protein n=1 Tax=Klenkia sp. PcliD-1-E TaxID=2954492 RepID=UPI002097AECD|nr:NAD-dependent epimerase/dehydratase family protein [Klenkia sp. PcliD-1-E]MCO7220686.1 hypothetical protein [Klenkia sp. PcliD-1-E]
MHLLVLGGGGFLGHYAVTAALGRGHEVTVLDRSGESPVEHAVVLTGDRDGDLSALGSGTWDAVLDTAVDTRPGPTAVRRTAEVLRDRVGTYCSVSALADRAAAGELLAGAFGDRVLLAGVGTLVGPRDPSDRFGYWPLRLARAREGTRPDPVLVPGDPSRRVEYADVRDVADWLVQLLDDGATGVHDAVGPGRPDTLGEVIAACETGAGSTTEHVELVWADEGWLHDQLHDVPVDRRPLWFPDGSAPREDEHRGGGLTSRPMAETARDTVQWAWDHALSGGLTAGLTAEREQELVRAWRSR